MRKGVIRSILVLFLAAIICLSLFSASASAQARRPGTQTESRFVIPKDKRAWAGFPWLVGGVLAAITLAVSFKDAKRTHLD